jgi:hypothetical protein
MYSTYLGGSDIEFGYAIEVDSSKNIYVCGYTSSTDFNTTTGAYQETKAGDKDAFVFKLNPAGGGSSDLIWSTFLGGIKPEEAKDLAIDSSNNVYITGLTHSGDFPTASSGSPLDTSLGGNRDAFCTVLNSGGNSLLYSTYFGGSVHDAAHSISLNSSNYMYITGETDSDTDLPTTPNCYQSTWGGGYGMDVFFSIIAPIGGGTADLKYSTYYIQPIWEVV